MWVPNDPGESSDVTDEPVPAGYWPYSATPAHWAAPCVQFDTDADLDDQLPTWHG